MKRPPRSKNEPIITRQLIYRILLSASMIVVGTMAVYIHETRQIDDNEKRRTTMTFTCFVLYDLFNSIACRSAKRSIFYIGLFSNQMYNYASAFCIVGQLLVVYAPFFQDIFQTEALSFWDLAMLVGLSSSVLWVDEGRKRWEEKTGVIFGGSGGKEANNEEVDDHASLLV
jgi:Ca2+-transporting ATPase